MAATSRGRIDCQTQDGRLIRSAMNIGLSMRRVVELKAAVGEDYRVHKSANPRTW